MICEVQLWSIFLHKCRNYHHRLTKSFYICSKSDLVNYKRRSIVIHCDLCLRKQLDLLRKEEFCWFLIFLNGFHGYFFMIYPSSLLAFVFFVCFYLFTLWLDECQQWKHFPHFCWVVLQTTNQNLQIIWFFIC